MVSITMVKLLANLIDNKERTIYNFVCSLKISNECLGGEIGRHRRLKISRSTAYRFDSGLRHHNIIYFLSNYATALAKVITTVK